MTAEHACPTQNLGLGFEALVCGGFGIHLEMRSGFFSECEGVARHSLTPSGMLLLQTSQLLFI
jgi:hypothetical protein